MRNRLTRLLYIGMFGLGVSIAMIVENYLSKSNSTMEYVIAIALLIFSIIFIVGSFTLGRNKKK